MCQINLLGDAQRIESFSSYIFYFWGSIQSSWDLYHLSQNVQLPSFKICFWIQGRPDHLLHRGILHFSTRKWKAENDCNFPLCLNGRKDLLSLHFWAALETHLLCIKSRCRGAASRANVEYVVTWYLGTRSENYHFDSFHLGSSSIPDGEGLYLMWLCIIMEFLRHLTRISTCHLWDICLFMMQSWELLFEWKRWHNGSF